MYNFIEMFAPSFLFGVLNTCMSLKYKNKIFIFNSVLNILYVITYKCNMLTNPYRVTIIIRPLCGHIYN